jgi:hypothetical protein
LSDIEKEASLLHHHSLMLSRSTWRLFNSPDKGREAGNGMKQQCKGYGRRSPREMDWTFHLNTFPCLPVQRVGLGKRERISQD